MKKQNDKGLKLKLIRRKESIEGYTISNIKEVLDPKRFTEFKGWLYGQTVGVYKREKLVYRHDFIRFLKKLPVLN